MECINKIYALISVHISSLLTFQSQCNITYAMVFSFNLRCESVTQSHMHAHTHTHTYKCMYVCTYVCVSYNTGKSALPDIYAQHSKVLSAGPREIAYIYIYIYMAKYECLS